MAKWIDAEDILPSWDNYFPEEYNSPYPDSAEKELTYSRICENRNCTNHFTTPFSTKRYCCDTCRSKENSIKKRKNERSSSK